MKGWDIFIVRVLPFLMFIILGLTTPTTLVVGVVR